MAGRPDPGGLLEMAGEEGFEPSNAGIKIRCLNQLGDSPKPGPGGHRPPCGRMSPKALQRTASGCRTSVRTTLPCVPAGSAATAARASSALAHARTRTPRIPSCAPRAATACQPLEALAPPRDTSAPRPLPGRCEPPDLSPKRLPFSPTASYPVSIRGRRRSRRSARPPAAPAQVSQAGGSRTGSRLSPTPSHERVAAEARRTARRRRARARSRPAVARQAEVPQAVERRSARRRVASCRRPARRPCGMRLSTSMSRRAASRSPPAARAPRAPRGRRLAGTPGEVAHAADRAVVARTARRSVSARSISAKSDSQQVIAVRAPPDHVQEEVQLRGRGHDERPGHGADRTRGHGRQDSHSSMTSRTSTPG